jgi:hypothetical protein
MIEGINSNRGIRELNLRDNHLTSKSANLIRSLLTHNSTITQLNLSQN